MPRGFNVLSRFQEGHGFIKRKVIHLKVFTAALAFMWPLKKTSNTKDSSGKLVSEQIPLKNADIMFETGHYELCYQLLSSVVRQTL